MRAERRAGKESIARIVNPAYMVLISLGTVTIVAMCLWVLCSVISLIRPLKQAKTGLAVGWLASVFWYVGVPV